MAQNQIRKGFFFYFGLLILFLVTLALIFLVVLIFSPNKDFIGLRYFSYTTPYDVVNTTGEESVVIDYSQVKTIEIDCGYADVSLQKGDGNTNWKDGIHIINDAKGFTTAANAIDFTYTATLENGKLVVKLTEPTGFMYFSKNINVILYANYNSNFFDDKELIVKTADDGNIFLGEALHVNRLATKGVTIANADIKTEKGNIYVGNGLVLDNGKEGEEHKSVKSLELYSGSGTIGYRTDNGPNMLNLPTDCAVKLKTANGRIDFNEIKGANLIVECDNGSVSIDKLNLTGDCEIHSKQGNFSFENVNVAKLNFSTSENTMISPDIDITGTLTGDLILSNATAGASPNVVLNKVIGDVNITSNDGSLKIKDSIKGTLTVLGSSTGSFSVEAGIENVEGKANFNIVLGKGNITLNLKDTINNNSKNNLATEKGNITLNMTSEAKFEAQATLFKGDKKTDKITLSSSFASLNENVLTVNGGTSADGVVKLATDENIKLNLITKF